MLDFTINKHRKKSVLLMSISLGKKKNFGTFFVYLLVTQQKINVILGNLSNVLKFLKSIEFFFIFLDRWHKLVKLPIQTRLFFLNYASHKSPSVSYP